MGPSPWYLRRVRLSKILGFADTKELIFHNGLQVIEASNHTGKTSLAIALIWGLTGQLPAIDRIATVQFRLKHKLASDNEDAEIEIQLEDFRNNQLIIRRSTKSSAKSAKLTVLFDQETYEGTKAQEIISKQLGLKPRSLEGCCVVLQDQRLSLITGDVKKSSEVIHDILGLSTLSKLVPILNKRISELTKLLDLYTETDPLKKWEEEERKMSEELSKKELEAVSVGYISTLFQSPQFLHEVFSRLSQELGILVPKTGSPPKDNVRAIRDAINAMRIQNPHQAKFNQLTTLKENSRQLLSKIEHTKARLQKARQHYPCIIENVPIYQNEIMASLQRIDAEIAAKQSALDMLNEQHGLFTHSLRLLQNQPEGSGCPLCQQAIGRATLLNKIQNNLHASIHTSLEKHQIHLSGLKSKQAELLKLESNYQLWDNELKRILIETITILQPLGAQYATAINHLQEATNRTTLDSLVDLCAFFDSLANAVNSSLSALEKSLEQEKMQIDQFERKLGPLETSLDNATLYLLPIHEIQRNLLEHQQRKGNQETKSQELCTLIQKAIGHLNDLKKFKELMQTQEQERANQVIKEHQEYVSGFFVRVADNPQYNSLSITAEEDHGSVKYYFDAQSSQNPKFTDNARHVLSGGDLSCACLGLILSLTRGKSNRAGFLVLDDPGESMDRIRMNNFATTLPVFTDQQTIVLTHQRELAECLVAAGAATVSLYS